MSAFDRKSYVLARELQPYFDRIIDHISFNVYHPTTSCQTCPDSDCILDNRYCIYTGFYGSIYKGLGKELITEQLREEIILRNFPNLWWMYMSSYDDNCDGREFVEECGTEVMRKLNMNVDEVAEMVKKSYVTKNITDESGKTISQEDNEILESNARRKRNSGTLVYPAVIVNNVTYRGNLNAFEIFELVCNSFKEQPSGCETNAMEASTPWTLVWVLVLLVLFFMLFLMGWYRRKVRRELSGNMNGEVNELVNQYITMYEAQRFDEQSK